MLRKFLAQLAAGSSRISKPEIKTNSVVRLPIRAGRPVPATRDTPCECHQGVQCFVF